MATPGFDAAARQQLVRDAAARRRARSAPTPIPGRAPEQRAAAAPVGPALTQIDTFRDRPATRWQPPPPAPDPAPPIYRRLVDERLHDPRTPDREEIRVSEHRDRDEPTPVPREVFDPTFGSDGGGRHADPLPAAAPDLVEGLAGDDELVQNVPWPKTPVAAGDGPTERDADRLVSCPCCGSGVHPSRITG